MGIGAAIGAGLGIIGSLTGGERASDEAMTGYDYAVNSPIASQYLPAGGAANAAIAELLGVGGQPYGVGYSHGGPSGTYQTGGEGGDSGADIGQLQAQRAALQAKLGQLPTTNMYGMPGLIRTKITAQLADLDKQIAAAGTPAQGGVAGGSASDAFNRYLNSTGYQFQLGQGQNAIVSSAAARGLLNSGATAKALTKYGQNLASTSFDNYLKQLGALSTQGLQGGQLITNAGTQGGETSAKSIGNAWGTAGGIAGSYFGSLNPGGGGFATPLPGGGWNPGPEGFPAG